MTKAQRKAIDRLRKKHRSLAVSEKGDEVRVTLLDPELPEDERVRVVRPSGLVEEPADLEGIDRG